MGFSGKHNNSSSTSSPGGNGFRPLGLSDDVYRGIVRMGFRMPTPVQRKALPVILTGTDTVVMARTGSGKTAAFLIPLLEHLLSTKNDGGINPLASRHGSSTCRAVILSPTRELSLQTLKVMRKLSHFCNDQIRVIGINGGESMEKQFDLLSSKPDVIIATPGRLLHHVEEIPDFNLSNCSMCILDEADRLLEMGFAYQIKQIAKSMAENCQKVLCSATMPKVLAEFTKSGFCSTEPHVIRLDSECSVSDQLRIAFVTSRSPDKDAVLLYILEHIQEDLLTNASLRTGLTLIFAATRHHVDYLATLLTTSNISCTSIYGTLDQEARKQNLRDFRTGKKPILIVTDVAARGIDVPLIDHVIHYHFPSSPKLFIHRSGRAARAGRIGFCWGLVDPEEMPYMIDLHLFLGRKPCTAEQAPPDTDTSSTPNNNQPSLLSYTLNEMTPDMVHYGTIPMSILTQYVENVQRILNSELTSSIESESLKSLVKVCTNAMKQYRRSRPEASREGVRRAKNILDGEKLESGQRIGGGFIPVHPLLSGIEKQIQENQQQQQNEEGEKNKNKTTTLGDNNTNSNNGIHTVQNIKKCEDFLRELSNFRPKETVFEAFATGGQKSNSIVSHIDKGRTTGGGNSKNNKKHENNTAALSAMKNMRRQMRIVRDKGATLVVAGSNNAKKLNGEYDPIAENENDETNKDYDQEEEDDDNVNTDEYDIADNDDGDSVSSAESDAEEIDAKKTKNKKEQKRNSSGTSGRKTKITKQLKNAQTTNGTETGNSNKKMNTLDTLSSLTLSSSNIDNGGKRRMSKAERRRLKSNSNGTNIANDTTQKHQDSKKNSIMRGADFRDPTYFIPNDYTTDTDEAHRLRQMEIAMQPSSANNTKGALGSAHRIEEAMLDVLGDENDELVQKQRMMRWDKSKRKYVQTTVGDELNNNKMHGSKSKKVRVESGQLVSSEKTKKLGDMYARWQKKTNKSVGRTGVFDDVDPSNADEVGGGIEAPESTRYNNTKNSKNNKKSGSSKKNKANDNEKVSAISIKKERERKENLKLKNMKKSDRRRIEQKLRLERKNKVHNKLEMNNGNRKKGGGMVPHKRRK